MINRLQKGQKLIPLGMRWKAVKNAEKEFIEAKAKELMKKFEGDSDLGRSRPAAPSTGEEVPGSTKTALVNDQAEKSDGECNRNIPPDKGKGEIVG